jgi:serine protease inhibitor
MKTLRMVSVAAAGLSSLTWAADASLAAQSLNKFGWDLARQTISEEQSRLISPFSAGTCLALLSNGAAGKTQQQIDAALHVGKQSNAAFSQSLSSLLDTLTKNPRHEVTVANGIFAPPRMSLNPAFVDRVKALVGESRASQFPFDGRRSRKRLGRRSD